MNILQTNPVSPGNSVIREWFQAAIGSAPFPYQEAILAHAGPLVINKARQTGISTTMACMAVSYAALGNKNVLIVSDQQDHAKHIVQIYVPKFLHPLIDSGYIAKPEIDQSGFLRWKEGGEIRCISAGENAGRGFDVHLAILDEFAHFTKEIDLDQRVYEAVQGTVAQTGGRLIFLSSPNGTKNLFYKFWGQAAKENRITVHWTDCPTLHVREEILPFGKQYWIGNSPAPMPELSFRKEFCNDFFTGSDEAIPLEALRAAMVKEESPTTLETICIGADIGREQDQTAYVVSGKDAQNLIWIMEIRAMLRAPFPEQMAVLRELVARHTPFRIVMDRTFNPQSTEDAQREWPGMVEPFVFGNQSKLDLLSAAGAMFTAGRVRCPPRNRQAIDEIANIRKVVSDAGNIQYKDKPHGDIGWAALLALWGLRETTQEFNPIIWSMT